ncbi:cation:proton antiporter [Oricola cellulosilytica]|uniref:Cation:proton antiporter n=1 Tax=Oricola cellulosilytica TaxID=1429082 RepID=A0A4R0PA08_9HYPH|nr:hypothetical protein E0D97_08335 [Oricola cellulosilytica]
MSSSAAFLDLAVQIALAMLSASFLLSVFKVIHGPTLPDRVLALDMLVAVAIGFIAVLGIKTGYTLYLDVAIALGLVGFLATVAFARFILARGQIETRRDTRTPPLITAEAHALTPDAVTSRIDLDPPAPGPRATPPGKSGTGGHEPGDNAPPKGKPGEGRR